MLVSVLEKTAYILGIFWGPLFTRSFIGLKNTLPVKKIVLTLAMVYGLAALGELVFFHSPIHLSIKLWISGPLLFLTYIYCLFVAIRLVLSGEDGKRRKLLLVMISTAVIVFPFALYQYCTDDPYLPHFIEHPLAFLILNACCLIFALFYLNQPSFLQSGRITEHFVSEYSITQRENEIINQLLSGKSNNAIATVFSISTRTVESHLYNVFQKTGVKNRLQLMHLIQSNS